MKQSRLRILIIPTFLLQLLYSVMTGTATTHSRLSHHHHHHHVRQHHRHRHHQHHTHSARGAHGNRLT